MKRGTARDHALRIFQAALEAADPAQAVRAHLRREGKALVAGRRRYALGRFRRIVVVGAGKAAAAMAAEAERILGARIAAGAVNVPYGAARRTRRIEAAECEHPIPGESGMRGAARMCEMARELEAGDLLLCLISGGASALAPLPAAPVTLEDKRAATALLLASGADIREINCVRKHLSLWKGGQLARLAFPAAVLTLALSDVPGDDLATIGSGPTVPDPTTFAGARAILLRYGLLARVPRRVRRRIEDGAAGLIEETPKPGDPIFRRAHTVIVGGNRLALAAAAREARGLGYRTLVLSSVIEGEARDVARMHAAIVREILASGQPVKKPACAISGGETTVTIRGGGLGGRNQEFALAAAIELEGAEGALVLSAGTDGVDGPTDAAGAMADGGSTRRAAGLGFDAAACLDNNDSYRFFDALGDLIRTGPTGTNVMDVRVMLAR